MGNCTGILSTCCGDNDTVKKIDKASMEKAYQKNQFEGSNVSGLHPNQDEHHEYNFQMRGNGERVKKPPVNLESGAIYEGEWLDNKRDGYGKQIWPDESKYEGNWLNDKANGYGKLFHYDGDIYEGEWQDDKANGKGTYTHANGARY